VPGRRKLEICFTPTLDAMTWITTSASSHAPKVRHR
jgi:hypothetical protein